MIYISLHLEVLILELCRYISWGEK